MFGVHFEPTFRAGDIITLVGMIGGLVIFFMKMRSDLNLFSFRMDVMDASVEDLRRDHGNGRVHAERLDRLEQDRQRHEKYIDDLRAGRGYLQDELDGEYGRTGRRRFKDDR